MYFLKYNDSWLTNLIFFKNYHFQKGHELPIFEKIDTEFNKVQ